MLSTTASALRSNVEIVSGLRSPRSPCPPGAAAKAARPASRAAGQSRGRRTNSGSLRNNRGPISAAISAAARDRASSQPSVAGRTDERFVSGQARSCSIVPNAAHASEASALRLDLAARCCHDAQLAKQRCHRGIDTSRHGHRPNVGEDQDRRRGFQTGCRSPGPARRSCRTRARRPASRTGRRRRRSGSRRRRSADFRRPPRPMRNAARNTTAIRAPIEVISGIRKTIAAIPAAAPIRQPRMRNVSFSRRLRRRAQRHDIAGDQARCGSPANRATSRRRSRTSPPPWS